MKYDVIVVGAGAAGLAAAGDLAFHGFNVLLLEARERAGGRIFTVAHGPQAAAAVDLGAEFIHGRPGQTFAITRAASLPVYETGGTHLFQNGPGIAPRGDFWQQVEPVLDGLATAHGQESFAAYAQRKFPGATNLRRREAATSYVEGFNAAEARIISARELALEQKMAEKIDEQRSFRIVGGYGQLIAAMLKNLGGRVELKMGRPVDQIHWTRGGVRVATTGALGNQETHFAAKLLLTVPLGVLQQPATAASALRFTPELPADKQRAAQRLAMGAVVKLVFGFRAPFWEELPEKSYRPLLFDMGFLHVRPAAFPAWWTMAPLRTNFLTAWAGGAAALKLKSLPREQLARQAINELADVLRVKRTTVAGLVDRMYWHNWQEDPFSCGAYSYVPFNARGMRKALAEPIDNTLYFAGEATEHTGLASTVAGAIASGQRAAAEIAAAHEPTR